MAQRPGNGEAQGRHGDQGARAQGVPEICDVVAVLGRKLCHLIQLNLRLVRVVLVVRVGGGKVQAGLDVLAATSVGEFPHQVAVSHLTAARDGGAVVRPLTPCTQADGRGRAGPVHRTVGECAIVKLLCFDGQRQKPFSCFDVRAATRAPIDLATETHWETLSVAEGGTNKVGSSTLVKVSMEKWRNISSSNPIALTCCGPGIGMLLRFARGGPGAGGGGAGGPLPQAQLVLAGWPA